MLASLDVPVLAAPPLSLRSFHMDDLGAIREAAGDPLIPLITTVPASFTEEEGRRFVERQWDRAREGVGYSFAIADEATDAAVGHIGLWPNDQGRASVGYWVIRSARHRGAAGCALQALTWWALTELRIPRLELYVEPRNVASIRTAERAGFRREGLLRRWQEVGDERRDMFMYSLLPDDLSGSGS